MVEKLAKEKKIIEFTLESIGDAVIATDNDANIIIMNHVAEELTGWSRADATDKLLDEIFITLDAKTGFVMETPFWQSLEHGLTVGLKKDTVLLARDGRRSYVSASSSPIRDNQDSIIGIVVVFRDISRIRQVELSLKEAKEEAETANRAKDEFLSNMSHEIRTPLNGIIGMTTLMLMSELNPEQKENLDIIKMSGDLLLKLVNDILDFSKIEAGKMTIEETEFDLREIILKNLSIHMASAEAKGLAVNCHIDNVIPQLLSGDPHRIQQVLTNLIGNAIKFTENGEIAVYAAIQQRVDSGLLLRISVSDTGIGIRKDQMDRLFRSFSQVDGSITRNYGGTGLGLYISKQLVNIMGGDIGVDSIPEQGSTFYFTVKVGISRQRLLTSANDDAENKNYMKKTTRPLEVLLVEDNMVNQVVVADMLTLRGHKVELANNGKEALQILDKKRFDVILMDIMMPELDGLETTAQIREREVKTGLHIPIIAITAHATYSDREKVLLAGMDDFIAKPVQMELLFHCMEKAVVNQTEMAKKELHSEDLNTKELFERGDEDNARKLEEDMQGLVEAVNSLDFRKIERFAHRIKELAYKMDAKIIKNLAFKIELSARKEDYDQASKLLMSLKEQSRCLAQWRPDIGLRDTIPRSG